MLVPTIHLRVEEIYLIKKKPIHVTKINGKKKKV